MAARTGTARPTARRRNCSTCPRVKSAPIPWQAGRKSTFPISAEAEETRFPADDSYGAIRALEATTGKRKWEYKLLAPAEVSTLATAGGLVFA